LGFGGSSKQLRNSFQIFTKRAKLPVLKGPNNLSLKEFMKFLGFDLWAELIRNQLNPLMPRKNHFVERKLTWGVWGTQGQVASLRKPSISHNHLQDGG